MLRQRLAVKNGFNVEINWMTFDQSSKTSDVLVFKPEDWEVLTKGFFQLNNCDTRIWFTGGISFQRSEDKSYHLKANVALSIKWSTQDHCRD